MEEALALAKEKKMKMRNFSEFWLKKRTAAGF
jgi:hypothetical protein